MLIPVSLVQAAALQVSPIRLDLSSDRPAAALTLHNGGAAPLNAQVRVFAWTQSLDEDRLERTNLVVASPPIAQIAPGADQTVRILRVDKAPVASEETYRLLIDEIPSDQAPQTTGVRMQLRYSVPVFVGAPDGGKLPAIEYALERPPAGGLTLRAANRTAAHAQLSRVRLDWPDGRSTEVSPGLLGYALPRATRRWPVVGAPSSLTSATLHVIVNGEPVTTQVSVSRAATEPTPAPASGAPAR
ncbi:molecular chaperone (plasmid) [Burkholderia sp. M6-3]